MIRGRETFTIQYTIKAAEKKRPLSLVYTWHIMGRVKLKGLDWKI